MSRSASSGIEAQLLPYRIVVGEIDGPKWDLVQFEASTSCVKVVWRSILVMPSHWLSGPKLTYAFVDTSLEIEVLKFAVGIRVLILQGFNTNGASIQSLLEAHTVGLALHAELSGNLTLFHD